MLEADAVTSGGSAVTQLASAEHQFIGEPKPGDVLGDGVRLSYLDWGPAPGPTILFLHGGGLTGHTWDVVCDLLHREYRCICLELRGHGDSEWSREGHYSLEHHAADLDRAVVALGLERFVLVGMSLGGSTSLMWAAKRSRLLRGLVLVDTGPRQLRAPSEGMRRMVDFVGADEAAPFEEFVERAVRFNPLRNRERLRRSLRFSLRPLPDGRWTWKYDPRIRQRFNVVVSAADEHRREMEVRNRRLWDAAAAVECPTLVVRGGSSDIYSDEDAERTAATLRAGRWLRIEGAGHTVQGDRPYELTAVLREFLANDVRAGSAWTDTA